MSPNINLKTANGWAILPSSLKHPDATPRFNLSFPSGFTTDQGAIHLIVNESDNGYEPPTRNLIERVLRRGDLFVDVGAHWGFFTMQAATHPAGDIEVVSFEPDLMNAVILTENVVKNKLSGVVTVVCAACGSEQDLAELMTNSSMGHSIRGAGLPVQTGAKSKWVPIVTLDGALARLQKDAARRVIVKIDAEGLETEIIAGAKSLLGGGHVALIVWECGRAYAEGRGRRAMIDMVAALSAHGFRHFQVPPDGAQIGADAKPIEFDAATGQLGNIFSVGPRLLQDPDFDCAMA